MKTEMAGFELIFASHSIHVIISIKNIVFPAAPFYLFHFYHHGQFSFAISVAEQQRDENSLAWS